MGVQARNEEKGLKRKLLLTSRGRRERHADAVKVEQAASDGPATIASTKLMLWSLNKLIPATRRVRKTSAAQLERVVRSVKRFGVVAPVLVDKDGRIIDGHIVVEAARVLGLATIPVVMVTHLDEMEVRGVRLALNRLGETGEWDLPALSLEVKDLTALDFALPDTGFTLPELDILMLDEGSIKDVEQKDTLPRPATSTVSIVGDLWQLGDHRLICGDATRMDVYGELLGDEKAHCVFGDPPFNIPIAGFVSGLGKTKHDDFVQGVGEWTKDEFTGFLQRYLDCCRQIAAPGAAIFACMDWRSAHLLTLAGEAAGLTHVNTCVWDKGSGGMGGLWRSTHEFILAFAAGKTIATNNVALGRHGRDRCNVWRYAGANKRGSSAAKALELHATPKPVPMVEDAICDVTNRGEVVLDPFLGSGTTLIAAHTTGRIGRAIELDPKFVDVAIRRFTELTGIEAVHAGTGRTFTEMMEQRTS